MKKNLKGLLTITMIFVFTIALTGCGKEEANNSKNPSRETSGGKEQAGGTEIADINISNWEEVVKENFLLDISLPSGWTIEEAKSLNDYSNVELKFIPNGETTYADFGETLFLKSKDVSTKQAPSVESFQASLKVAGTSTWRYYPEIKNSIYVQINYHDNKNNIEITINR